MVKVWYGPNRDMGGSTYPTYGFIYQDAQALLGHRRLAILDLIRRLHEEGGLTVIVVSHLLDDVANHVRRIAIVERAFFQAGPVGEVLTSSNLSKVYNMPVSVERLHDKTIILAGNGHGLR